MKNYTDPSTVVSPRNVVSDVEVLYNTGEDGWSLASLLWNEKPVFAMRWNGNATNPIGNPQSRGIPTWFVVPDELGPVLREGLKAGGDGELPPLHARLKLLPLPRRRWQGEDQPPVDDTWVVTSVDLEKGRVTLSNPRTEHFVPLWVAHIAKFAPDPLPTSDGLVHGTLNLTVQLVFEDGQLSLHPLYRAT
jgi:hypothetical protein